MCGYLGVAVEGGVFIAGEGGEKFGGLAHKYPPCFCSVSYSGEVEGLPWEYYVRALYDVLL